MLTRILYLADKKLQIMKYFHTENKNEKKKCEVLSNVEVLSITARVYNAKTRHAELQVNNFPPIVM